MITRVKNHSCVFGKHLISSDWVLRGKRKISNFPGYLKDRWRKKIVEQRSSVHWFINRLLTLTKCLVLQGERTSANPFKLSGVSVIQILAQLAAWYSPWTRHITWTDVFCFSAEIPALPYVTQKGKLSSKCGCSLWIMKFKQTSLHALP